MIPNTENQPNIASEVSEYKEGTASPENINDGSELATDRMETLLLRIDGSTGDTDTWLYVSGEETGSENVYDSIYDHRDYDRPGQATAMNGFITYIPKHDGRSGIYSCVTVDTEENRALVAAAGYEFTQNVGVLSFRGDQELAVRPGGDMDPSFLNAQVELLKLLAEKDSLESFLLSSKKENDLDEITRLEGEISELIPKILDARVKIEQIAKDKPRLVRNLPDNIK